LLLEYQGLRSLASPLISLLTLPVFAKWIGMCFESWNGLLP